MSLSGTSVETDSRKVDPRLLHPDATGPARLQVFAGAKTGGTALPVFIRLGEDDPDLPEKFLGLGGAAKKVSPRIYVGEIPPGAVRYVSHWPKVAYIDGAKQTRRMLDVSRPAVLADVVQAGTAGFPSPFDSNGMKGDNVYLGFVDTGLYGGHPDFHTGGTGPSRVVHTYSSTSSDNPLVDEDGHGTHVAGIAAGNGFASGGKYTGMAPAASMMTGKTSFTTTNIVAAVQNLIDYAESRTPPRPVAINLSLGLVVGPNDGTSGFESAVNALATGSSGSRRIIAAAAGNEQDLGEHIRAVVSEPFGARTVSLHLLSTLSSTSLPQMEFWAYGTTNDPDPAKRKEYDEYTVTVNFPGASDTVTVPSGRSLTSRGGLITVSNRVDTNVPNGATHITLSLNHALAGKIGTIRFDRTRNGGTGVIDGYVDYFDGFFQSPALSGNTIEPANGDNVLAVGSFKTKTLSGSAVSQEISSFSSFGPSRDGRLKPDIAAPGEFIYSTRSLDAPASNYAGIVTTDNDYAIDAGTSMATPHVTGVAALVWQSNPSLTGAQMRERLRRTASLPTDGSTPPNIAWGYGKLNALRAAQNTIASISGPVRVAPGDVISLTSENSSGGFGAGVSSWLWTAPGATLGSPTGSGTTFTAATPGVYTVSLTATSAGSPGTDSREIVVNRLPVAGFTVPAAASAGQAVTFRSTSSDQDPQSLAYHWVLVSRPTGSAASITSANVEAAAFTPDVSGTYEIGLRADDGVDNSALVVLPYTTQGSPVTPASSGGGGGGCLSISRSDTVAPIGTSLLSIGILFLPAWGIGLRRFSRRRVRTVPNRHPFCW